MKILFVLDHTFKPTSGGVQRTTWLLGEYFQQQKHQVYFFTFQRGDHGEHCPGHLEVVSHEGRVKNKLNTKHIKLYIQNLQPDIVINQIPHVLSLGKIIYELKQDLGFKIFSCIHGSLFNFKVNMIDMLKDKLPAYQFKLVNTKLSHKFVSIYHQKKYGNTLKAMLKQSDKLILLAPSYTKELRYFITDYPKSKVEVIPNPVHIQDVDVNKKENTILYVGRLDIGQKRSDLLIEFWRRNHHRLKDWKFVVVGDGAYRKTMQKSIENEDLPRISLEGTKNPEPYYRKASIFLMTSAYEGFPNVLLEAQSFGCASVLFNSYSALNWIVEDGKDALLSKAFDITHFSENVYQLCNHSKKRIDMQNMALKNVERFSINTIGQEWEKLFGIA